MFSYLKVFALLFIGILLTSDIRQTSSGTHISAKAYSYILKKQVPISSLYCAHTTDPEEQTCKITPEVAEKKSIGKPLSESSKNTVTVQGIKPVPVKNTAHATVKNTVLPDKNNVSSGKNTTTNKKISTPHKSDISARTTATKALPGRTTNVVSTTSTNRKKTNIAHNSNAISLTDSLRMVFAGSSSTQNHNAQHLLAQYARRFNVSEKAFQVPSLYKVVDEWLGTPYRYGRNDKKGTDCSGLIAQIYGNFFKASLPRSAAGMSTVIDPMPINKLKEGDLVFFTYNGRQNSHVGLYLQNGWFIHASSVNGVTLNNLNTAYYRKRFSKGGPLKMGDFESLVQSNAKI